jgi:hypothetical protein
MCATCHAHFTYLYFGTNYEATRYTVSPNLSIPHPVSTPTPQSSSYLTLIQINLLVFTQQTVLNSRPQRQKQTLIKIQFRIQLKLRPAV